MTTEKAIRGKWNGNNKQTFLLKVFNQKKDNNRNRNVMFLLIEHKGIRRQRGRRSGAGSFTLIWEKISSTWMDTMQPLNFNGRKGNVFKDDGAED